ncbi:MAG: hypothetical protein ABIH66_10880 [bacterium]
MYKFKHVERFPCSKEAAYEGTTVSFDGLEKYIPNVTRIKVLADETTDDGNHRWLLHFHGDGAIPAIARAVVKPGMLRWKEEMICNPKDLTIKWEIITDYFTEHVHCGGTTYYKDTPKGSEVLIDGYFEVTLSHLPPFPDVLVKKAVKLLEPFVGRLIAPNLGKFYKACKKMMKDQGKL